MKDEQQQTRIGLARTLARNLLKKAKVKETPTSLRTIIIHLQKEYNLEVFPNSTLSDRVSGMLVTVDTELLDKQEERYDEIHYNENNSWHRNRFTIAHEIGHLILNTSCDKSFLSFNFTKNSIEAEANQFAAELLIPLTLIKKDLQNPNAKISQLAWKYIVSKEAMGWKISSCNLLGRL